MIFLYSVLNTILTAVIPLTAFLYSHLSEKGPNTICRIQVFLKGTELM